MLDPDPYQMNTDPKHYFLFQLVIEQCCSAEIYIYLFLGGDTGSGGMQR
jgi:hypothetical protein